MATMLPLIGSAFLALLLLAPIASAQTCEPGPDLFLQVPIDGKSYNGPTILEGDVFEAGVVVTVFVDGVELPVTLKIFNPGQDQFWRWTTPKLRTSGLHTAIIRATDGAGNQTEKRIRFRLVVN